jgi:hypothetical protein
MEILPHLWIADFENYDDRQFLKEKKIKSIINLSKYKNFSNTNAKLFIDEIRIPIEYNEDNDTQEHINNIIYEHFFDITEYIHERVINMKNVLLVGYSAKEDIDAFICAYFIRYAKIDVKEAIKYVKSKKNNSYINKILFYPSLNKFYNIINKI